MSERSHWGWGFAAKFPNAAGQTALASQLGAVLGLAGLEAARPVPLDAVELPPPIEVPDSVADLCRVDDETRVRHTYGKAYRDQLRGFRGDFAAAPGCVATPADEADIERVFEFAARRGVPVVPFGGGSSVVGGVECPGAISLDMARFDQVLEVDDVSRLARIQGGIFGPAIEAALRPAGLTLRHFPQSFEFSTLGGWVATRAGGHFATVYTHIDDLVAGTRMWTPGAGVLETRRLPGSGAGPSPDRLVLGSEGALGVITEAWMRIRPRPTFRASVGGHFEALEQAAGAARALAQSGLFPTNCRLLDRHEARLNFVADAHVVLVGFESADHPLEAPMARAVELLRDHGATLPREPSFRAGERDATAGSWRDAFLSGPYLQSSLVSLGVLVDTFETACTWAAFPALDAAVREAVRGALDDVCGPGGQVACRFTHVYPDGPAPYYTFIGRARAGAELEQWAAVKSAASEALLAHGATITHHHAVGRAHRPWYDRQRPQPFADALRAAKSVLDPAGLLNPGVLL